MKREAIAKIFIDAKKKCQHHFNVFEMLGDLRKTNI